jgi:hypothetical protein
MATGMAALLRRAQHNQGERRDRDHQGYELRRKLDLGLGQ